MITLDRNGMPKVARVGVALVDGALWSSGTRGRIRTERLRRDPRCVVYVHSDSPEWLAIEATVTILDGPDAPELNLKLFRLMQGKPSGPLGWFGGDLDEAAFLQTMRDEERLVFEFAVGHTYGIH
jgi:hypothetical protein